VNSRGDRLTTLGWTEEIDAIEIKTSKKWG
jgi:hypothetical protein